MGYRTELHIHTRFSKDSLFPLWLLYLICRIKKISCIAITDHNEIIGAQKFKANYHKVSVIVGEEIFTNDGEIIGLFLSERIAPGMSARKTIDEIKRQEGIVYIPHPYDEKRKKSVLPIQEIEKHRDEIQCIECYNGRTIREEDLLKQKAIAERFEVMRTVGSDAHTFFEIGRNYHIFSTNSISSANFLECLAMSGVHTGRCIRFSHVVTKFDRAIKMLSTGDIIGLGKKLFLRL